MTFSYGFVAFAGMTAWAKAHPTRLSGLEVLLKVLFVYILSYYGIINPPQKLADK